MSKESFVTPTYALTSKAIKCKVVLLDSCGLLGQAEAFQGSAREHERKAVFLDWKMNRQHFRFFFFFRRQ
jgi:hypothetical protein